MAGPPGDHGPDDEGAENHQAAAVAVRQEAAHRAEQGVNQQENGGDHAELGFRLRNVPDDGFMQRGKELAVKIVQHDHEPQDDDGHPGPQARPGVRVRDGGNIFNAVAHGGNDDDRHDDDGQDENGVINRAHFKMVPCGGGGVHGGPDARGGFPADGHDLGTLHDGGRGGNADGPLPLVRPFVSDDVINQDVAGLHHGLGRVRRVAALVPADEDDGIFTYRGGACGGGYGRSRSGRLLFARGSPFGGIVGRHVVADHVGKVRSGGFSGGIPGQGAAACDEQGAVTDGGGGEDAARTGEGREGRPFHFGRIRSGVQHVDGIEGGFRLVAVPSADDEQLVSVSGEGGFRNGDGEGRKLFHGAVRLDQQGVFQDAFRIMASGYRQPLAYACKSRVTQRSGQRPRLAPLAVAEFENILVVRLRPAFFRR